MTSRTNSDGSTDSYVFDELNRMTAESSPLCVDTDGHQTGSEGGHYLSRAETTGWCFRRSEHMRTCKRPRRNGCFRV